MYNDPEYFSEEEKMEIDKVANAIIKTASHERIEAREEIESQKTK